ncbi:MAG: hypothetical protein CM1200mP3_17900 [Chloroflexota bacterium]|nr:MAG: hypothetical protein CM1200mP3_17900 [Chloroflexota bacterium]
MVYWLRGRSGRHVFNQNIDGKFDVCLAMYHEKGHIPIKVHDWERSVSVNLGLPFIRTSVDHGPRSTLLERVCRSR